jgi:hypothetical protein
LLIVAPLHNEVCICRYSNVCEGEHSRYSVLRNDFKLMGTIWPRWFVTFCCNGICALKIVVAEFVWELSHCIC